MVSNLVTLCTGSHTKSNCKRKCPVPVASVVRGFVPCTRIDTMHICACIHMCMHPRAHTHTQTSSNCKQKCLVPICTNSEFCTLHMHWYCACMWMHACKHTHTHILNRSHLEMSSRHCRSRNVKFIVVLQVLVENGRAVGVEFTRNGTTHQVKARREVILSAGTVRSPQILMLSGIGPKKHLQDMGVG